MPRYRAHVMVTDKQGHERVEVVEIDSPTDNAEDLARAAMDKVQGFDADDPVRLPHNIRWERLDEE